MSDLQEFEAVLVSKEVRAQALAVAPVSEVVKDILVVKVSQDL
jgi:hypothetical protein